MNLRTWTSHALLFVTLLLPACSSHQQSQNVDNATYFVMTGQEAERLVQHCSSRFGEGVEGYWSPSVPDLRKLEAGLKSYLAAFNPDGGADLFSYTRQYAGVIKNGRRLICVNGLHKTIVETFGGDLSKSALILVGGGRLIYGVEYDVETKAFNRFSFNGDR